MFSKVFKRKGIYIALLVLSLIVLACSAAFILLTPMGFAPPTEFGGFESGQLPGGFGEGYTPPVKIEKWPAAALLSLVRANIPAAVAVLLSFVIVVFSIVMLIRTGRRERLQREMDDGDDYIVRKKKSGIGPYFLVLAALFAVFLSLLPEPSDMGSEVQVQEELIEATAEKGSITRTLITAGSVSESSTKALSLAGDIKVEHWYVNNGDYVQKGQVLAELDKDSVILSIARLTELMAKIDADINKSLNDVIQNAIYAPARGRVKAIYARPGMKVQDTVAEHSALMRLSLDGLMAADIEAGENVKSGMKLSVQLSDGSFIDGSVESVFEGVAVVVMSDEKAAYGEKVSIFDAQGAVLGEAELYIHREVKISGLAGTVQRLNVEENMLVGTDIALVVLTDTAYRGNRDILTERRREMEEELTKLFEAYNSGRMVSSCNGRIAAINEDIILDELADNGAKLSLTFLAEEEPSMKSYAVSVKAIEEKLYTLSYSDGLNNLETQMDLSEAVVFKYVNGKYIPGSPAEISVGDSLLLSCYINGGSTVLDHVVLFSNKGQGSPGGGTQSGQGGSRPAGGGQAAGSNRYSGSTKSGVVQSGTGTEDAYAISRTILSYISPYDEAEIAITVDELDISAYRVGQSLSVTLDALPGQSFSAAVRAIDPNGGNEGGNTKYTVTLVMPRTEDMLSGMNASVRLDAEIRQDILTIPLSAVCEKDGRIFVYTSYDAGTDTLGGETEIETGLSDGESVEIVSGLTEGERYFYRYAETIKYNFQQ